MSTELFNVADIFGENVFNDTVMQERLPKKVYKNLRKTIEEGKDLDLETADVIAHEMKEWAIEKGATHYTHWFLPLTGVTAEKHDSFISAPLPSGKVLMTFSGKELIKGEPDTSSFPSVRRTESNIRGKRIYSMGLYITGIRKTGRRRSYTLHSNSILLLYRRGTGSEDTVASFYGSYQ